MFRKELAGGGGAADGNCVEGSVHGLAGLGSLLLENGECMLRLLFEWTVAGGCSVRRVLWCLVNGWAARFSWECERRFPRTIYGSHFNKRAAILDAVESNAQRTVLGGSQGGRAALEIYISQTSIERAAGHGKRRLHALMHQTFFVSPPAGAAPGSVALSSCRCHMKTN